MGLRFSREDVQLGAIPAGVYVTDTTTTPAPTGLPNRAIDWGVLAPGTATQVLTVNADGSIGWAAASGGFSNPMTTAGDIIYRGTSGAATRLGIGTAGQALVVNSGATAPQWGTASGGTVTSVSWTGDGTIFTATADTAVTTSGTLTPASLIAQTKSTVLAGPTSGGSAAPTFRALLASDFPTTQNFGASTINFQTSGGYAFNFISNINLQPNYSAAGNSGVLIDTYSQSGTLSYPLGFRTPAGGTVPIMFLGKNSSAGTNRGCGYIDATSTRPPTHPGPATSISMQATTPARTPASG